MFDELILGMEREVDELKAARQRATAATSTTAYEITCQSKATMNSSGNIIANTEAWITITPDNGEAANNLLFTASQDGVQGDGTSSFTYSGGLSEDGQNYILAVSVLSYAGAWNANEQKTITHHVRVVATSSFTYTVTEEAV